MAHVCYKTFEPSVIRFLTELALLTLLAFGLSNATLLTRFDSVSLLDVRLAKTAGAIVIYLATLRQVFPCIARLVIDQTSVQHLDHRLSALLQPAPEISRRRPRSNLEVALVQHSKDWADSSLSEQAACEIW